MRAPASLLALPLLLVAADAAAVDAGLLLGAAESVTTADPSTIYQMHTGIAAGARIEGAPAGFLGISLEALYANKGASVKQGSTPGALTTTGSYNLGYLELPVLLQVPLPVPLIDARIIAGGFYAIRVSGGYSGDPGTPTAVSAKTSDYGPVAGFELSVRPSPGIKVLLSARLDYSLPDINLDSAPGWRNHSALILVGLLHDIF